MLYTEHSLDSFLLRTLISNMTGNLTVNLREDFAEAFSRQIHIGILFTLAVFALIGNSAVILGLSRNRCHQRIFTNIDILIFNLAVADFLVALFCLLADAIWKYTYGWLAGDAMCKGIKFLQMFGLYASTFVTASIAIDRCIAVRFPMRRLDHRKVIRRVLFAIWILASAFSLPQIIIFRVLRAPGATEEERFDQCVTYGAYSAEWQEPAYVLFTFCAMFAVPFFVIALSYGLIFSKLMMKLKLRAKAEQVFPGLSVPYPQTSRRCLLGLGEPDEKREAFLKKARMKSFCVSVSVIITFLVCWVPYYVCVIYYVVWQNGNNDASAADGMFQYIFCFGMSSSVINPVVYGAFHVIQRSPANWKTWSTRASISQGQSGGALRRPVSFTYIRKNQYNSPVPSPPSQKAGRFVFRQMEIVDSRLRKSHSFFG